VLNGIGVLPRTQYTRGICLQDISRYQQDSRDLSRRTRPGTGQRGLTMHNPGNTAMEIRTKQKVIYAIESHPLLGVKFEL